MEMLGKKISSIKFRDFVRRAVLVWYFSHRHLFFLLFLVTVGAGVWFWKQAVYQYHWTDAQKRAYLNEHAKETSFKEDKFTSALDAVAAKERALQDQRNFRDIFYPEP